MGRDAAIRYRIRPADPHAHLFEVAVEVDAPDPEGQRLSLPTWIPGSYLIREFARHVVSVDARQLPSRRIAITKVDKHTWRAAPCRGTLRVTMQVYAWDLSVRGAHLDASHGFFNGTSVFLQVHGRERERCTVEIEPPPPSVATGWKVATTLPRAGARPLGFGRYQAPDYDALIDHPVELGRFAWKRFEAAGVPHEIALTGRHDADLDRLARDLAPVCSAQAALFEPQARRAPVDRYLFLVTAVGDGYGGLEHRASTALLCARADLPSPSLREPDDGYRRFLGLASHEYFHTWNVKRIKPQAFAEYDLSREATTRLLWIFEGFTSYYDDLMLARAGVIDAAAYLRLLGQTVSSVLRGPGRLVQSVAESSFDAWIKYYRPDENTPNAVVSYYAKGALVALCLDLTIRRRTRGARSLDDVMRALWVRYGREFFVRREGLPEDGFPALVREACGLDLGPEIAAWAEGTEELPLAPLLAAHGVALETKRADAAWIGARLATRGGDLTLSTVHPGGPAHRAGLAAGDVIVALDGLRVDEKGFKALLSRRGAGARLAMHAFRRDELMRVEVVPEAGPATEAQLAPDARAGTPARRLRNAWLGAGRG